MGVGRLARVGQGDLAQDPGLAEGGVLGDEGPGRGVGGGLLEEVGRLHEGVRGLLGLGLLQAGGMAVVGDRDDLVGRDRGDGIAELDLDLGGRLRRDRATDDASGGPLGRRVGGEGHDVGPPDRDQAERDGQGGAEGGPGSGADLRHGKASPGSRSGRRRLALRITWPPAWRDPDTWPSSPGRRGPAARAW